MGKIEEAQEIVKEIRQYLCNTEFAPEPFTKSPDMKVLFEDFPARILRLFEPEPDQSRLLADDETVKTTEKGIRISVRIFKNECFGNFSQSFIDKRIEALLKAQRDLIASIKDAECDKKLQEMALNYNTIIECEEAEHQARIEALVEAYDVYIKALEEEIDSMAGIAYVHGWRAPDASVECGKVCRKKIKALKGEERKKRAGDK